MKTIFKLLILFCVSIANAQVLTKPLANFYTDLKPSSATEVGVPVYYKDTNNFFTPFLGTWTAPVGNTTFVVTLWKETQKPIERNGGTLYYKDIIFGHYKLVQNYNTVNETVIYTTQVNFLNSITPINTLIYATCHSLNKLDATIFDVNTRSQYKGMGERGNLEMTITSTLPTTATWKVSYDEEINRGIFIIPTNLILTKQ